MNSFNPKYPFLTLIFVFTIFSVSGSATAETLTVSMAYLPNILETPDKGAFVDIIKAIDEVYDGSIIRGVYPVARSMNNVISGKADFHLPMIRNKVVPVEKLPYAYTTEKMGDVYFVIYSHKDNPITLEKIKSAKKKTPFPLTIETIGGMLDYFDFPMDKSFDVDSSLKKIGLKRVDAFIFAQEECDYTIRQLKLKDIHREMYDKFDDVFVIPKGEKGERIDKILSSCIKQLKSSGKMQALHMKVHVPYQLWQPHEMGW